MSALGQRWNSYCLLVRAYFVLSQNKKYIIVSLYSPEAVKDLNKKYGLYGSLGDQVSGKLTLFTVKKTFLIRHVQHVIHELYYCYKKRTSRVSFGFL